MLLVDWLQENDFFYSLNKQKNGIFYVYMTTSVSACDIIQITLNDLAADISFVAYSHHIDGGNS